MNGPSALRLRELLEYDPQTGLFRWKNPGRKQARGWFRGNKSVRTYRRLWVENTHILAHVVAWVLMTGNFPDCEIDHRDRDQSNNIWSNLRLATHEQNMRNQSLSKRNKTGVRGVSLFECGRYRATINVDRKKKHLGLFDTVEAATESRKNAEANYYGEWA